MPITRIKRALQKARHDFNGTATYVRLALGGNKINRLTDFEKCDHPVLLLYGFGATRRVFSILEQRLRKDGFCVFSFKLGGMFDTFNTHCIEEKAVLVRDKVERLCKRFHLNKISIVGHSKGGLIGRYYIKRLRGTRRVKTLITLGTPHGGNPWALLGLFSPFALISKSIWQMVPMSPFLRRLQKGIWPKQVRFVSIYSKDDKVCFYKSAKLDIPEGATHMKNIEMNGLSHSGYLIRKQAYRVIRKELLAKP